MSDALRVNNIHFGNVASNHNQAHIGFTSVGIGSTANYGSLQFIGVPNTLCWTANGTVGIGTTNPQAILHVQGGTLVTNPTVYNTAVAGWYIIGYWDCSAAQNSGAHLKLRIMGCNGYDNTGSTPNQMGGETTIYLNNLNNLNTTTNANVDGSWKHEGGIAPFISVKAVQGSSRYQYFIYASVQSYTQHSITAETTQGTIWTSQFTSTSDPGANSLTVKVLTLSTVAVGTNVGIGTTAPTATLDVVGAISLSGTFTKNGTTTGYDTRISGGTATNSGYVDFFANGTSRGYIGNANTTDMFIVAQNGAQLSVDVAGSRRLSITTSGNIIQSGGVFFKNSATATSYMTMNGGDVNNSPFTEYYYGGLRRCYIGNASTTEVQFASENGAQINFLTGGTSRMIINTSGNASFTGNVGVSGRLQLAGTSHCEIYNGNVDTYNPTGNNNLMIRSWWGIGFPSYDNVVRIGLDTRSGNANFAGTVSASNISTTTYNGTNMRFGTVANNDAPNGGPGNNAGYVILVGGLCIQWGSKNSQNAYNQWPSIINFPIAFTTVYICMGCSAYGAASGPGNLSNTGCHFSAGGNTVTYIAIGYYNG